METGKQIIIIGVIIVVVGFLWMLFNKQLNWIGNLPGDFKWENGNSKIYFPLTTMLLISILINVICWIYKWMSK